MAKMKAGPIVSDNGNFIIDAPFPEEMMRDPLTVRFSPISYLLMMMGGVVVGSVVGVRKERGE